MKEVLLIAIALLLLFIAVELRQYLDRPVVSSSTPSSGYTPPPSRGSDFARDEFNAYQQRLEERRRQQDIDFQFQQQQRQIDDLRRQNSSGWQSLYP